MKKNGFAVSSLLYMSTILFGVILFTTLTLMNFSSSSNHTLINSLLEKLENKYYGVSENTQKQYRHITESGVWSDWINYENISEVSAEIGDVYFYDIYNMGAKKTSYNLENHYSATEAPIVLNVNAAGQSYLDFSADIHTRADTVAVQPEFPMMTLYIDYTVTDPEVIIGFNDDIAARFISFGSGLVTPNDSVQDDRNTGVSSSGDTEGVHRRVAYVWNQTTEKYEAYRDGILETTVSSANHAELFDINKIALGYSEYHNIAYYDGEVYDIRFSSTTISAAEAIAITKTDLDRTVEVRSVLNTQNTEVIYGDYIEYREINKGVDLPNDDLYSAKFINDYISSSNIHGVDTTSIWKEIKAIAEFTKGKKFNGMKIGGGTFSGGAVAFNHSANTVDPNPGEIFVPTGFTYTTEGLSVYEETADSLIVTPFESTTLSNNTFLVFIGSDTSRFTYYNATTNRNYLYAKWADIDGDGIYAWHYGNNTGYVTTPFTQNSEDRIIGKIEYITGNDITGFFTTEGFDMNVALGAGAIIVGDDCTETNVLSNATDGNLSTFAWLSGPVCGIKVDFDISYPISYINVLHYDIGNITYFGSKTVLEKETGQTKVLYNSDHDGLYIENSLGSYFPVNRKKTLKTTAADEVVIYHENEITTNPICYSEVKIYDRSGNEILFDVADQVYPASEHDNISVGNYTEFTNVENIYDNNINTLASLNNSDGRNLKIDLKHKYSISKVKLWYNCDDQKSDTGLILKNNNFSEPREYLLMNPIEKGELIQYNLGGTCDFSAGSTPVASVNAPELVTNMYPVYWNGAAWEVIADTNPNWYSYFGDINNSADTNKLDGIGEFAKDKWANVHITTTTLTEGNTIAEADLNMYVWIPRYSYKMNVTPSVGLTNTTNGVDAENISIKYSTGTTDDNTDSFLSHPGFTFGTSNLTGIWVAKFEMSANTTSDDFGVPSTAAYGVSRPSVKPWRNVSVNDIFNEARTIETELSITTTDSHMIKSSEWSAVAYLSEAIRDGEEVWINNQGWFDGTSTANNYKFITTGCSGTSKSSGDNNATSTGCPTSYDYKTGGVKASSTGNIYGIYDMSGGSWEYMATYINDDATITTNALSLKNAASKYKEFINVSGSTATTNYSNASALTQGLAIHETSTTGSGSTGWYGDYSYFPYASSPVVLRGGTFHMGSHAGMFAFSRTNGGAYLDVGWRATIVVE